MIKKIKIEKFVDKSNAWYTIEIEKQIHSQGVLQI